MFVSYAILTHNEGQMIAELLMDLTLYIESSKDECEVVILDDYSSDAKTQMILRQFETKKDFIRVSYRKHDGNFANQKNALTDLCKGEWIFNIDADERPPSTLLDIVHPLIDSNPTVEVFSIPRLNTVDGLTEKHIQKWNWRISYINGFDKVTILKKDSDEYQFLSKNGLIIREENDLIHYKVPIIMWPDFQMRLYKNNKKIRWVNAVHEVLSGHQSIGALPPDPLYALRHFKDIKRQEQQNELYDKIQKG